MQKMHSLEDELESTAKLPKQTLVEDGTARRGSGKLKVNAPLPGDFSHRFVQGVSDAAGCDVRLTGSMQLVGGNAAVDEIGFDGPSDCVQEVVKQAADPESSLAKGSLHTFLVSRDDDGEDDDEKPASADLHSAVDDKGQQPKSTGKDGEAVDDKATQPKPAAKEPKDPIQPEYDMAMPFGGLEPFGREDTGKELTDASLRESDAMVDQLERAETAEERRAVFRALTRLRGAAISSYDGIARAHTSNMEDYARKNQWRKQNPLRHLAEEESDVSRWAFPDESKD